MRKQELEKLCNLKATKKMMRIAAADTPQRKKEYNREIIKYKHGLYLRCKVQNGILVVAFYFVETLRLGGRNPSYVLFVDRSNERFITYDAVHSKWRTAMVCNLHWPDHIRHSEGGWISGSDLKAIRQYIGESGDAYHCLLNYQRTIRYKERLRRYKRETDPWDEDLTQIPALPKDWALWVDKVGIRENYIFYHYVKKGAVTGYCSYCEKDVPIKRPRHNKQGCCPYCRHKITFKSVGKAGTVMTARHYMYLIQRCRDGFVIREFTAYRKYPKGDYDKPERSCSEIRRAIFDENGLALRAYYWGDYKHHEWRWKPSGLCSSSYWGYEAGAVYGKTLPSLAKNELKRTGLVEAAAAGAIDPEKYLAVLQVLPQLEQIGKANLPQLANECMDSYYHFRNKILDCKASSLSKMLRISTQELKRLRQNNGGTRFLDWLKYEKAIRKAIPDYVINWYCAEKIKATDLQFVRGKMSALQIYNYVRRQMDHYRKPSAEVLTTWADYLSMAKRLKMNTDDRLFSA